MLKRFWFVISLIWAACNLLPDLNNLDLKLVGIALAPFALGWFVEHAGRFVVTGSPRRNRGPVPYLRP